jgi:hypothetical protein
MSRKKTSPRFSSALSLATYAPIDSKFLQKYIGGHMEILGFALDSDAQHGEVKAFRLLGNHLAVLFSEYRVCSKATGRWGLTKLNWPIILREPIHVPSRPEDFFMELKENGGMAMAMLFLPGHCPCRRKIKHHQ